MTVRLPGSYFLDIDFFCNTAVALCSEELHMFVLFFPVILLYVLMMWHVIILHIRSLGTAKLSEGEFLASCSFLYTRL